MRQALVFALLLCAPAAAQATRTVELQVRQETRLGQSVYVLGDLPELGGGDVTRAVRMVPGPDRLWWLKLELPAGARYRYAFVLRQNDPERLADPQNGERLGDLHDGTVPGDPAWRTVTVHYLSGWSEVRLAYRKTANEWAEVALQRVGPGRGPGEHLYRGELRTALRELAFVPQGPGDGRDLAPDGQPYRSGWAELTLASGALHPGLRGPGQLDTPRQGRVVRIPEWQTVTGLAGGVSGGGGETIRRELFVYLPPGYDPGDRRYPVLYAHDGQNLFGPDAMFGGWRLEDAADRLIASGQMAPIIIVGVANTPERMSEYMPEEDEQGRAGAYGQFLIGKVKPFVDARFRTRPERESTGVLGSSLGGLVSLYLGWERSDVFSRVGSLSGSFWLKGWVEQLEQERRPLRIWLDSGNAGNSSDSCENTIYVRDLLLRRGWVLGGELDHFVDLGASHNERFWRGRVHQALRFLFPPE